MEVSSLAPPSLALVAHSSLISLTRFTTSPFAIYEVPVSSDFEFSIKNYAVIPADEIFFKGMLVPSRGDHGP